MCSPRPHKALADDPLDVSKRILVLRPTQMSVRQSAFPLFSGVFSPLYRPVFRRPSRAAPHTRRPGVVLNGDDVTMTLFTQLDAEWRELGASAAAAAAMCSWARDDAPLRGFADPREVVHFVQRSDRRELSEEVVACLAARAPSDPLAARALLQVVLYGLIRIAADFRGATYSEEEVASVVIAMAYERIRTYPIDRRPRSVIANVLLDTRQAVSRSLCRKRVPEILAADVGSTRGEEPEMSATDELLALLDEAVRGELLRLDDARLIVLTRIADVPTADLAVERGCAPQSLRRRRQRAEAALAAAVECVA